MIDNTLSKVIETWMKIHLVSDGNCSIANPQCPKRLQGMTDDGRSTFSAGDTAQAVNII